MADEQLKRREESKGDDPDVVAHRYVAEEINEDDPESKRRRRQADEPEGKREGDEPGKRKR